MKKIIALFSIVALLIAGCTTTIPYYELPRELVDSGKMDSFSAQHTPYLQGRKIFIDPGHGGKDRRSVGPQKLVTEADINLRVALYAGKFLESMGATVVYSRRTDTTVELSDRSVLANESGCEFFISIHHNAPGRPEDKDINYTSTYYHALETDEEYEQMERDIARFIQRDLSYAMRNSGGLGSFDGTYSDYNIYPKQGFAVLRNTDIPSVLVECSFFTNPHEEQRLAIDEFNKLQGWGIARGFARYLRAGYPTIKYLNRFQKGKAEFISFFISDSSKADTKSLKVFCDSLEIVNVSWNEEYNEISVQLPDVRTDNSTLRILVKNIRGNAAFTFRKKLYELQ